MPFSAVFDLAFHAGREFGSNERLRKFSIDLEGLRCGLFLDCRGEAKPEPIHTASPPLPTCCLISKMMAMSAWRNTDVREKSNLDLGNLQGKAWRWEQAGKGPVIEKWSLDMTSGLAGLCKGFGRYSRKPEATLGWHDQTFSSHYKKIISHDY